MANKAGKKPCKFGTKCYRKSKQHLEEYSHPLTVSDQKKSSEDDLPPPSKKVKRDEKDDESVLSGSTEKSHGNAAEAAAADGDVGESSGYKRVEDDDPGSGVTGDSSERVDAPVSPADVKSNIKSKFLVEMPEDFYDFWEFVKSIDAKNPRDALQKSLGVQLVGPYDVLAGVRGSKSTCWLRHWRYYYDPPEFLTVIRGDDKMQFHMGYYRDDPREMPVFMASNSAAENGVITPRGNNVFAAVSWCIDTCLKKDKGEQKAKLTALRKQLSSWASDHGYSLDQLTSDMKARKKKVVSDTFHKAGIVVPIDANEVGYRELPETDADLKKLFKKIKESKADKERDKNMDPLMEIVMLVQFANDECDYGEGLELGLDLFTFGDECFHKLILNLLPLAYQFLGRQQFGDIIKAHLEDRKSSVDLSQLT